MLLSPSRNTTLIGAHQNRDAYTLVSTISGEVSRSVLGDVCLISVVNSACCATEVWLFGKFMEENIELLAFSVYFMLLCN